MVMTKMPQSGGACAIVADPPLGGRPPNPANRCLRLNEVCALVGLKESALRQMMARGDFPSPFKLSARAVAWLEADIDAWITLRSQRRVMFKI
jgi:prophage regulatory protein